MAVLGLCAAGWLSAAEAPPKPAETPAAEQAAPLKDQSQVTTGSFSAGERRIAYQAETGVMVVHLKDPLDEDAPAPREEKPAVPPPVPAQASMSYVAYFRTEGAHAPDARRPITFLFNGGPGSSTVWLHMGAFGPKRVVTADDTHTPAAPYRLIDNEYSLLDVSDLVFIDAPGTGFGHLRGTDKEKAFWGVDQDAHAFANFIHTFLSRHGRWNSPKYLFGESYGSTRAAALTHILAEEKSIDLNGVLLIGQILNFDNNADTPQANPGVELPYALVLPSYAASAWYHHRLQEQPAQLEPFLREVETFALNEYLPGLIAGSELPADRRAAIAAKLHQYTGLPPDYIERADLRINTGMFTQQVLGPVDAVGRLDARFSGPVQDALSKESDYDPQATAISSAYVATFNDYVRGTLKFGDGWTYKASADVEKFWDFQHQQPGQSSKGPGVVNVMPDLATAMKHNPKLKVQLNNGYYDLATPYFAALYELRQLQIPASLRGNLEWYFYQSGHMIYAHEPDLKALHAHAAGFIQKWAHGGN
ncbi:MAG: peptidase S10 [Proteobacteria bacterium]|nr:peptidase S10 [Pseudomonadota bacterium]